MPSASCCGVLLCVLLQSRELQISVRMLVRDFGGTGLLNYEVINNATA